MSDLNDILEGEDTPVDAVEPTQGQEAPQAPQEAVKPTVELKSGAESGVEPKGESAGTPPAEDKAEAGLKAGIAAERRKRQEAEARYAQDIDVLRREIAALKQPQEPPAPPPSVWDDEQGTFNHYGKEITSQAVQVATQQARLDTSAMMAAQEFQDFRDIQSDVLEYVKSQPVLQAEVMNNPHPWKAAYTAFKNHETMTQLGVTNLEEVKAKMREELMAEMQAQPTQPQIPASLADAQSARGSAQAPGNKPMTLEDILSG